MRRLLLAAWICCCCGPLAAQCPYISGALIDAVNTGTPTGEGKNEFVAFNTGAAPLAINAFSVGYGTTTAATDFTINGASVTWLSLPASPVISNSAGTITNITSGSIPANTNVVILNAGYAVPYDLATFGTNVYVLVYNSGTGVSGYTTGGNFANKSSPSALRYFRISSGACNNVVSYDKNATAFAAADGAGAKWDAAGSITFASTGGSGAVLPLGLKSFTVQSKAGQAVLRWSTAARSNMASFTVQKSTDGVEYQSIAELQSHNSDAESGSEYEFADNTFSGNASFYRLKITDASGVPTYTASQRLSVSAASNSFVIYPNPVCDKLFIASESEIRHVWLRNSCGQLVADSEGNELSLALLPAGIYYLQIQSAAESRYFPIRKE